MAEEIKYDKEEVHYKPTEVPIQEFNEAVREQPVVKAAEAFDKNVLQLLNKYLGYVAPPFPLLLLDPKAKIPAKSIRSLFKQKGSFGPIKMPLKVQKPTGADAKWISLPLEPIVSVRGSKDLVVTHVSRGRDSRGITRSGSIKEVINMRDYVIEIEGIIIGENEDELPVDEIAKVHNLCEYGLSLKVQHDLLNALDINWITIYDFDIPTEAGEGENVQKFKLLAYSDEDFEKELLGN